MKRDNLPRALVAVTMRSCLAALVVFCACSLAWAQFPIINNSTSTPIPGSGHDYIHMLAETVSPGNGSVSLSIGLPVPEGRQMTLPFSVGYSSNGVFTLGPGYGWKGNIGDLYRGGWTYAVPLLNAVQTINGPPPILPGVPGPAPCIVRTGYVFNDRNGTRHSLYMGNFVNSCVPATDVRQGGDDVIQAAVVDDQGTVRVAEPNGTVYKFPQFGCNSTAGSGSITALPKEVEDRNGNKINFGGRLTRCPIPPLPDLSDPGLFTETDTLGRTVLASSGFGHTGDTLTISGLAQPYTVTWDTTDPSSSLSLHSTFKGDPSTIGQPVGCLGDFDSNIGGPNPVISAIMFPNGQQFQFTYDVLGLLTKITYPSGGYVAYTWDKNPQSEYALLYNLPSDGHPLGTNGQNCPYIYDSYAVSQRQVSFDGVTVAEEQDFSYSTTWRNDNPFLGFWASKQTVVTTHDLLKGTRFKTIYTYAPVFTFPQPFLLASVSEMPVEQSIVYEDFDRRVLRTVNKSWIDPFELASEQTALDNGFTSQITYSYGPAAQVTETDEFDYGQGVPGPLVRKKITSYATFSSSPLFPSPSILDRPAISTTYDGGGNPVAQTVYCYDQTTPTDTSAANVAQHDYTHYSSTFNVRGNFTQELRWLNPPGGQNPLLTVGACGQSTPSSAISTVFTYDDTGQRLTMTDPKGFRTDYSYGTANGYLVQAQTPAPDATGAHGTTQRLSTLTNYDFNSGLLMSTTDPNQKTTTYLYNDPLNRLTRITRPDGGSTRIDYGDAVPDLFVHVLQDMDSGRALESYSYVDGMGRSVRTLQFDGTPGGPWVASEISYDGVGREASATNPHRVGIPSAIPDPCSATILCTTSVYDAIGRIRVVTASDGQSVTTDYLGNRTRVTDQALLTNDTFEDTLGRIVQVTENPTNVNNDGSPVTVYSYSALGDLVQITQGAQKRYFSYNSLRRRVREFSPEEGTNPGLNLLDPLTGNSQWSAAYGYDNNSNLQTKTDTRGIVTTYGYDALNRIIRATYSDVTPTVDWLYDSAGTTPAVPNAVGRLTQVSSSAAKYTFDSFDVMGNALSVTQTVDNQPYRILYQYDLAGHLITETYPSLRVVTTGYDAAGRPFSLDSSSNTTAYVTNVAYAPHGAISDLQLGNGFWEHRLFDPARLQTTEIDVGSSKGAADVLSLQYGYVDGNGKNNGNVQRQMITAPVPPPGPNMMVTQLAMYDGLNRLSKMQEVHGSNVSFPFQLTAIWEQDFALDALGNRTGLAASGGLPTPGPAPAIDPATNRFVVTSANGFKYDAAGNLTQEPVDSGSNSYIYDANNHLVQSQNGGQAATYSYDGFSRRVKKIVGGQSTVFVYDVAGRLVAEYSPATPPNIGTRYLTQDILGSTRLVTGTGSVANPAVVARYDFLPFGEIIPSGLGGRSSVGGYGPVGPIRQLFTGKEKDSETNLDFFLARYSSSEKGRFTSPDEPFAGWHLEDPQSLNLYAYVGNNPLGRADIDGHDLDKFGQEVADDPDDDKPLKRRRARRPKSKDEGGPPKVVEVVAPPRFIACEQCRLPKSVEWTSPFVNRTPEEKEAFLNACQREATARYNREMNFAEVDKGFADLEAAKDLPSKAATSFALSVVVEKALEKAAPEAGVAAGAARGSALIPLADKIQSFFFTFDALNPSEKTKVAIRYQREMAGCKTRADLGLR